MHLNITTIVHRSANTKFINKQIQALVLMLYNIQVENLNILHAIIKFQNIQYCSFLTGLYISV
jgi:hypothetical protein